MSDENAAQPTPPAPTIGGGEPSVDFNGTRYTNVERRAANPRISIGATFDPLRQKGIALTTTEAETLGVHVGQTVIVHDNRTNRDVEAVYHDNAGRVGNVTHFEVSPALADALNLRYRWRRGERGPAGEVGDFIAGSQHMRGRFTIRRRTGQ